MRIPARELEAAVCCRVAGQFGDALALAATTRLVVAPSAVAAFVQRCGDVERALAKRDSALIREIVRQVRIHDGRIEIECDGGAIAAALKVECQDGLPETVLLLSDVRLTRSGRAMRLVQDNGARLVSEPDRSMIKLLVKARGWWAQLRTGDIDVKQLAAREGVNPSYVTRVLRLAFLSPTVIDGILVGATLSGVDAAALTATDAIPGSWDEQERRILGGR